MSIRAAAPGCGGSIRCAGPREAHTVDSPPRPVRLKRRSRMRPAKLPFFASWWYPDEPSLKVITQRELGLAIRAESADDVDRPKAPAKERRRRQLAEGLVNWGGL